MFSSFPDVWDSLLHTALHILMLRLNNRYNTDEGSHIRHIHLVSYSFTADAEHITRNHAFHVVGTKQFQ